MILINSIDEYLGYCIASHLSQYKSIRKDLRMLYNINQPWVQNFNSKGMDTRLIKNYTNPNELSQAMRSVNQVILTLGVQPHRVANCKQIINVAIRSGVKSIIFLSHIGAQSETHSSLYDYGLTENYLIEKEEEISCTILRLDFIQQYFHLWASLVDQTRTMALPLGLDTEICPIDISDVCRTIENFVTSQDRRTTLDTLNDKHAGQVYTLTGPEALTSKEIIQFMSNATTYKQFKYHMVRPMDIKYYLKNLSHNIWFDERIKNERLQSYRDLLECENGYRLKALAVPNGKKKKTINKLLFV
jgi:hypothetical protein